jgi:hypothetical protein
MSEPLIDGVTTRPATAADLATFTAAGERLNGFEVPKLYDSSDANVRVFVVLFDGTGNNVANDPQHATNVGILSGQVQSLRAENSSIGFHYEPGPGTQGGLAGLADSINGSSYGQR